MDRPLLHHYEVTYRRVVSCPTWPVTSDTVVKVVRLGRVPGRVDSYTQAKEAVLALVEACDECHTVYAVTGKGHVVEACDCPPF